MVFNRRVKHPKLKPSLLDTLLDKIIGEPSGLVMRRTIKRIKQGKQ